MAIMMSCQASEKKHSLFLDRFSSIRLVMREREKLHAELRNSRIVGSIIFTVLIFTVRDKNTRSGE